MHNKEALDMMLRCKEEIASLRLTNDRLRPKAEAYDVIAQILGLLPRGSIGYSEDLGRLLARRIEELQAEMAKPADPGKVV